MWRLARRPYWITVVFLVVAKVALVTWLQFAPAMEWIARHLDTGFIVVVTLAVGARFKDAGWSRWLGMALVLLITMILPLLILSVVDWTPHSESPLDSLPWQIWLSTVAFLALLIVAGIKRSVPAPNTETPQP